MVQVHTNNQEALLVSFKRKCSYLVTHVSGKSANCFVHKIFLGAEQQKILISRVILYTLLEAKMFTVGCFPKLWAH